MGPISGWGKWQRICELVFETTTYIEVFPVNGKIKVQMNSSFWSCPNYIQKTYMTFKTGEENVAKNCQIDKSARQNLKL